MAIAFYRGREVNRTQWALGRYPWRIVIVLSIKDGRKQNKEQCNQAVNKTVTTLTIGEHVSVWLLSVIVPTFHYLAELDSIT